MNRLRSRVARAPFLAVLVVLLVGLFAFLLFVGFEEPAWANRFFGTEEKLRVLEYLGVGMGGLLLAIGAVVANRRAVAMEETNRGAEDGRRQERLKNAIEHLGHESDSVRLGGAYELFHLARDTEDLRQAVLDVLCAHIRRMTGQDEYQEKHGSKPSTEIQGLLTLLFSRKHVIFKGCSIDLQGSWMNGADLTRARLQEASLFGVQLQEANLDRAQLQGANLKGTQLQGANLKSTQLQGANLDWAQLQGTILFGVQLQEASLFGAQLQGANLFGVQLQCASLLWAQLQGANLHKTQLQGANPFSAQLQGANLNETQLQGAIIIEARLQGVTGQFVDQIFDYLLFKMRINEGVGRKSDLSGATFAGGLIQEDMGSLIQGVSGEQAKRLRAKLKSHIDKPASHELPEDSGAITGAYTKEAAERLIAEYQEATGKG